MTQKHTGRILRGVGGKYEVLLDHSDRRIFCPAKGGFRHDGQKPLPGDMVEVLATEDTENKKAGQGGVDSGWSICRILERKNTLIRPALSNLDVMFVTFSPLDPIPAFDTIDKLVALCEHNRITPVILVTKSDLAPAEAERIRSIYDGCGYASFCLTVEAPESVDELRSAIRGRLAGGKTAAFAGVSGVGKSTMLNLVFPELSLETGSVSLRTGRGRHTTRQAEFFVMELPKGDRFFIADTPGFSMLDFEHFDFMTIDDLLPSFCDIARYASECRYGDCTHTGEGEDECAVKGAVVRGEIAESRYDSYRHLYDILKQKRQNAIKKGIK